VYRTSAATGIVLREFLKILWPKDYWSVYFLGANAWVKERIFIRGQLCPL